MTGPDAPHDRVAALLHRAGLGRWIGPHDGVVVVQAAALAALAWPGRPRWRLPAPVGAVATAAMLTGAGLGLAAARPHGTRLTPRVEPPEDTPLHRDGPYAVSRNPMYTGLLVSTAGWALLRRRPEPVAAWLVLLAALTAKARQEEQHLLARFGAAYEDYRQTTPRFLPRPSRTRRRGGA